MLTNDDREPLRLMDQAAAGTSCGYVGASFVPATGAVSGEVIVSSFPEPSV